MRRGNSYSRRQHDQESDERSYERLYLGGQSWLCERPGCGHRLDDHNRQGDFTKGCDLCDCVDFRRKEE